jgi:hypothetical protein
MRKVPIVQQGDLRLSFDECDVRKACNMMHCGKQPDECIGLMMRKAMECVLCYLALRLLKRPYELHQGGFPVGQCN